MLVLTNIRAQELVQGGDMNIDDASAWTVYFSTGTGDNDPVATFGFTDDSPSAGQEGCLQVEWYSPLRVQINQAVTLQRNHTYRLTGAFKNISRDLCNANWLELYVSRVDPNAEGDVGAGTGDFRYQMHSWKGDPYQNIDNVDSEFQEFLPLEYIGSNSTGGDSLMSSPLIDTLPPGGDNLDFTIPDTVSTLNWFVVIKFGNTSTSAPQNTLGAFTFLFDNISLWDLAEPLPSSIGNMKDINNEFNFYPNPVAQELHFSGDAKIESIEIVNLLGAKVLTANNINNQINVSALSSGVYLVKLYSNGNLLAMHKMLKK